MSDSMDVDAPRGVKRKADADADALNGGTAAPRRIQVCMHA